MHTNTHRAAAFAAALILVVCCAAAGCDSNAIILRDPVEGPPATTAPAESAAAAETEQAPSRTAAPTPVPATPSPTEVPTPEPTPVRYEEGMRDPEVMQIQERLRELGYLHLGEDELTDYYGPATRQAVERFQRQCGLGVDGIAGETTLSRLNAADAPVCTLPLTGLTIGIDPGHQARGNNEQEPVSPGSSQTKPKVSSGTEGVSSHVAEYVVNLAVGLRLRDLLEEQGANVLMTRDTHDVNISNAERAQMMNDAGADLVVRIHCDGEDDSSRNGAFVLIPVGSATSAEVQSASRVAAESVLGAFVAQTGAKNLGLSERDDQTGFNWSTVPVINIEMGHMSNPAEDQKLVSEDYQALCAQGIANGIIAYFS